MAMWEIGTLLKSSMDLVRNSGLTFEGRRYLIWNLENIPQNYQFYAECFESSEGDKNFDYKTINPYELGLQMMKIVSSQEYKHLIYDWSAFLLNFYIIYKICMLVVFFVKLKYVIHFYYCPPIIPYLFFFLYTLNSVTYMQSPTKESHS